MKLVLHLEPTAMLLNTLQWHWLQIENSEIQKGRNKTREIMIVFLPAVLFPARVCEQLCLFPRGLGIPYEADVDYTIPNDCLCVCVILVSSFADSGPFPGTGLGQGHFGEPRPSR